MQAGSWLYIHKPVFVLFSVPNPSISCVLNWSLIDYFENNNLSPYFSQQFLFSSSFFLLLLVCHPLPLCGDLLHTALDVFQTVNDTLPTSDDSPFASKMGGHLFSFPTESHIVLLQKNCQLYLSGMHVYISPMFEQVFSGLLQMKAGAVYSCYYCQKCNQKASFQSGWRLCSLSKFLVWHPKDLGVTCPLQLATGIKFPEQPWFSSCHFSK